MPLFRKRAEPAPRSAYKPLIVRKLAGDDGIARTKLYDRHTGLAYIARADTEEPFPWPLERVHFADLDGNEMDPPQNVIVLHGYERNQSWVELVGTRVVHRPGGSLGNQWSTTHTFLQAERIVLHLGDRDVTYRVVHQPDKYDDETGQPTDRVEDPTTHVDWFYLCDLERSI